ncbi:malate/L-lactate dehydrogenase [Acetobacter nitrogenifigens DSM 23921 = NBRC 105050]|uniref:Lactate dehydrogenase n=2 Tax=Acetobacter nitrogenifigens TaxID=285268 RepID=A0A511XF54_9PROT|nr:Ldh family oxidoreductase [Acetobacter nitrogenifigens]GBQ97049.1 malate/L-lactate dehydrogenase [Acetobacter nitrogenifigens DSM 23921 = NBRC 105050]GEN61577.1 lactate dehydrogenase [Acetobacter nitrogenifigens DSM 23921 = NBRC 105050]
MKDRENKQFLPEAELTRLAINALEGLGLSAHDATDAARILIMAEMFGLTTHGVGRIESYGERLQIAGINPRPNISLEQVAPAMARLDGDNGVGPLVGYRALEAAMKNASDTGAALVLARGSNHFGPVSPYSYIAAEAGFASLIGSNATTTIAPWGGKEARLGNSPCGFGFPNPGGDPFILDMAISVAARAKIRNAAKAGQKIPDTWATDQQGRPTTDPNEALNGFLLPIGGHKGYGMALVVDLLAGLLSGAAYLTHVKSWVDSPEEPQNLGHYFLLIDTKRLGSAQWLSHRMNDFAKILHSTPAADPATPVLVPGEIENRNLARSKKEGIAIDASLLKTLEAFASPSSKG